MLDIFLPLHRVHEQRIFFVKNKPPQPVPTRKTFDRALTMFKGTPADVGRNARVYTGD
jgi:hypothetical protein